MLHVFRVYNWGRHSDGSGSTITVTAGVPRYSNGWSTSAQSTYSGSYGGDVTGDNPIRQVSKPT